MHLNPSFTVTFFLSHFAPQVILCTVLKLIHWQHENLKGVRARSLLNKTTSSLIWKLLDDLDFDGNNQGL